MREADAREYAAIFCGGFVGAIARIALVQTLPGGNATWPWATFSANMAGAFLLGYFTTRLQERLPVSSYWRPLLGTGFCGAFTTFSTWMLESHHLGEDGRTVLMAANLLLCLVLGPLACAVGRFAGGALW